MRTWIQDIPVDMTAERRIIGICRNNHISAAPEAMAGGRKEGHGGVNLQRTQCRSQVMRPEHGKCPRVGF